MQKSDSKSLFKSFSEKHDQVLLFSQKHSWWEEVVQDNWEVAIVEKGGQIQAVWPYYIRQKGPWKMIAQAPLSPYAGPFLLYPEGQKNSTKISFEHKVYEALLDQLPQVAEIELSFPLSFKNGLAFLWKGFQQQIKYTYVLHLGQEKQQLWSGLRENIRRQIRKAKKSLRIEMSYDAETLDQLVNQSFESRNDQNPIAGTDWIKRCVTYLEKHRCGAVYVAKEGDITHAGIGVIYDAHSAYYLIGGAASQHKNSGAMSLLMWEAIKAAKAKKVDHFNFEGSSIPSIEKYLRGFGGELNTFPKMVKRSSKSFELLKGLKS
ncbi:MAG: GNAT family N-acetyltransferase [Vicingaceae bacterium]